MNIVTSTIQNSRFKALATVLVLSLIPHFFVVLKPAATAKTTHEGASQSIAFGQRGRKELWQAALWQWLDVSSPLIFTDLRRKMSFSYTAPVVRFPFSPVPLADPEVERQLLNNSLDIGALIHRPKFEVMLAQTFDHFSVTPQYEKEPALRIPDSTFFRTVDGTVIDIFPAFDREVLLMVKPDTEKSTLEVSQVDSTFPRVVVTGSSTNRELDMEAVRVISKFLIKSENKPLFKAFFKDQSSMTVEVIWMWSGSDD